MNLKKELFRYIKGLLLTTLIVAVISLILFSYVLSEFYRPVFWLLLAFFFIIHLTGQSIVFFNESRKKLSFANAYMLSFSIKFFGYIIFLLIYFLLHRDNVLFFGISLLALYAIFTLYETRSTISFSKRTFKKIEK